jgi:hypothetical protein
MAVKQFKTGISKHVEITNLGELHWLLGIEIKRDRERRTVHLSQWSYVESIIRRYNFEDLKPVSMPMDCGLLLSMSPIPKTMAEWAEMQDIPYREAVGSLMYAALGTHPDIAFAVQAVSRYSTKFGPSHWSAVKRIFQYLKGSMNLWLTYGHTKNELIGYADADGSTAEDRHAISGYASSSMAEPYPGAQSVSRLCPYPRRKVNTSLLLTPRKRPCGFGH